MSKIIDEVRQKINNGQNLFRRSTIEKMLAEYDRLLMRNVTLENNAVEHSVRPTAFGVCPHGVNLGNQVCSACEPEKIGVG